MLDPILTPLLVTTASWVSQKLLSDEAAVSVMTNVASSQLFDPVCTRLRGALVRRISGADGSLPRNHDVERAVRRAQLAASRLTTATFGERARRRNQPSGVRFAKSALGWIDDQIQAAVSLTVADEALRKAIEALSAPLVGEDRRLAEVAEAAALATFRELSVGAGGAPPDGFEQLFLDGDDSCPPWIDAFGAFLAEQIKTNPRFNAMVIAANLAEVGAGVGRIEAFLNEQEPIWHSLRDQTDEISAALSKLQVTMEGIADGVERVEARTNVVADDIGLLKQGFLALQSKTDETKGLVLQILDLGEASQAELATRLEAVGPAEPLWDRLPFPGLRPFHEDEHPIFFGRDTEVSDLVAAITQGDLKLVCIGGDSGTGKSSLVRAGLFPKIRQQRIGDGYECTIISFSPGELQNPIDVFMRELSSLLPSTHRRTRSFWTEALEKSPSRIVELLDAVKASQRSSRVVIFVDQFEEIFEARYDGHRAAFMKVLRAATDVSDLSVILTLRTDQTPRALADEELAPLLSRNRIYPLGAPRESALISMIEGPARLAGLQFDPQLTEQILTDAGPSPGRLLPLIAFCLEQIYARSPTRSAMTKAAYIECGGLLESIAAVVASVREEVEGRGRSDFSSSLALLFGHLVTITADGNPVRRYASLEALSTEEPAVVELAELLVEKRLLLASAIDGVGVITLAHDTLLAQWDSLGEWIDQNRQSRQRVSRKLLELASEYLDDRIAAAEFISKSGPVEPAFVPPLVALIQRREAAASGPAVKALAFFGDVARPAVPDLIAELGPASPGLRSEILVALTQIGMPSPSDCSAFVALLESESAEVVKAAARAIESLGNDAREAAPPLSRLIYHSDHEVRIAAIRALTAIGADSAETMPVLIGCLDGYDPVRLAAINALQTLYPPTPEVLRRFLELGSHRNVEIRNAVVEAVCGFDLRAENLQAVLIEGLALRTGAKKVAVMALGQGLVGSPALVELLLPLAAANEAVLAKEALNSLRKIANHPDGIETLVSFGLTHDKRAVRQIAADLVGNLGGFGAEGVRRLLLMFDDRDEGVRLAALGALVKRAASEIPSKRLIALLQSGSVSQQVAVVRAMRAAPFEDPMVEALNSLLPTRVAELRDAVFETLRDFGSRASAAVPKLIEEMGSWDSPRTMGALEALGGLGPSGRKALARMMVLLCDERSLPIRAKASATFYSIASTAVGLSPSLGALLRSDHAQTRCEAARLLHDIECHPYDAPTVLAENVGHPDHRVRAAVLESLVYIRETEFATFSKRLEKEALAGNHLVCRRISTTLGPFSGAPDEAVQPFLRIAEHSTGNPQLAALWVLAGFRPPPPAFMRLFTKIALGGDAAATRRLALRALDWSSEDFLRTVCCALGDIDVSVAKAASAALRSGDATADMIRQTLVVVLEEAEPVLAESSVRALGRIGPDAAETVPAILQMTKTADAPLIAASYAALGQIGPLHPDVVPALIEGVKSRSVEVQLAAVRALGEVGVLAKEAGPIIQAFSHQFDRETTSAAQETLAKISTGPTPVLRSVYAALGLIDIPLPRRVVRVVKVSVGE